MRAESPTPRDELCDSCSAFESPSGTPAPRLDGRVRALRAMATLSLTPDQVRSDPSRDFVHALFPHLERHARRASRPPFVGPNQTSLLTPLPTSPTFPRPQSKRSSRSSPSSRGRGPSPGGVRRSRGAHALGRRPHRHRAGAQIAGGEEGHARERGGRGGVGTVSGEAGPRIGSSRRAGVRWSSRPPGCVSRENAGSDLPTPAGVVGREVAFSQTSRRTSKKSSRRIPARLAFLPRHFTMRALTTAPAVIGARLGDCRALRGDASARAPASPRAS